MADERTRPAAVAGQFYPGQAERLQSTVMEYLARAEGRAVPGRVRALIVPHAGYSYSGPTAAQAFALLAGRTDLLRAVVLAPSHRVGFRGVSVGSYERFATPLGESLVDVDACRRLVAAAPQLVSSREDAHAREHALEVELPFVQTVVPEARLVPVVCGEMSLAEIRSLAGALAAELWRPDTVWIVSSDFTHFGRSFGYLPFSRDIPRRLEELDKGAVNRILDLDCEGFCDYVERTGATICGRLPIAVLLAMLEPKRDRWECRLLQYTTSGAATGDFSHCVSYASIAVSEKVDAEPADPRDAGALSEDEKQRLLALARQAICELVAGRPLSGPEPETLAARLREPGAAFVTLHQAGRLRGCIGDLQAIEPLFENVIHNARNAAAHDPRFRPVTAEELPHLAIEVSVLTPLRPVAGPEAIVLGRHGILLSKARREAVFLPQVATEQGWDLETTLRHLARKAGLESDAWRQGATLSVFEAIVFGEEPRPQSD